MYMVINGVPFRRHLHSDDTGSISSPSSSESESFKWASKSGTVANLCRRFTHIWYRDLDASARWFMMLFVATTFPPFWAIWVGGGGGGTSVAELDMDERDVEEADV